MKPHHNLIATMARNTYKDITEEELLLSRTMNTRFRIITLIFGSGGGTTAQTIFTATTPCTFRNLKMRVIPSITNDPIYR